MISQTIKSYLKAAAVIYVLAVTAAAIVLLLCLRSRNREVRRLEGNQQVLMEDINTYRTKDGLWAAETKRLQLSVDEYRSALETSEGICAGQKEVISSLRLKVRRLESVQQTTLRMNVDTVADYQPQPFTRDTLPLPRIAPLETPVSLMTGTIEWHDPWVSVCVRVKTDGKAAVSVSSVDTLYQIVHRVPRRFLFIPFGTKAIRQEVVSSNPHTRIVYSEYIELKK